MNKITNPRSVSRALKVRDCENGKEGDREELRRLLGLGKLIHQKLHLLNVSIFLLELGWLKIYCRFEFD